MVWARLPMSKSLIIFLLLNIYGDIRCVNLIDGNDFLAYNKVTLISPISLEVKLKKISGHKMSPDWQFTSIITITVTYQRKSARCAVKAHLLLILLYIVCVIVVVVFFFQSNASMCTHIRGVRKRYSLPLAKQMTSTG